MTVFIGHKELESCKITQPSKKKIAVGGTQNVHRRSGNKIV